MIKSSVFLKRLSILLTEQLQLELIVAQLAKYLTAQAL